MSLGRALRPSFASLLAFSDAGGTRGPVASGLKSDVGVALKMGFPLPGRTSGRLILDGP